MLVPIVTNGELSAFVCLGPKRSGDVYTAGECALLGAVADRIGAALAQFDSDEVLRQKLDMYNSLRRYVPGSLAERIERGQALDAGEREVSVLFIDIRGYTSLAEERRAEEVFSLVSRYTRAVGEVLSAHGGTIVEFNGDGMMAVFGAPDPHPAKEHAAVSAARELVGEARRREGRRPARRCGSASGSRRAQPTSAASSRSTARSGARSAAPRTWRRGSSSSPASSTRRSRSTRAPTRAAGEAAKDFAALAGVRIRGREQPEDIYVLRRA